MDIELLSFTLDGKNIETAPSKGAYDVSITCNNGAEGYWDYEEWGVEIKNITKQTKCNITFTTGKYFSEYIKDISKSSSNVVKVSHEKTEQTPALEDYRYVGSNPDNYVYFGCSENCTDDNLYRVIGVIPTQSTMDGAYENRVKLIKANYYTEEESGLLKDTNATYPAAGGSGKGYMWNSSANNQWQGSVLQSRVLNGVYWSSLGEYQNYISPAVWYLGAPSYASATTYTVLQFYNIERGLFGSFNGGLPYMIANIGLMYPSDYGYSAKDTDPTVSIRDNAGQYVYNAWLYQLENKYYEWTMMPERKHEYIYAWNIASKGYLGTNEVANSVNVWGVRPTFYLKADVQYKNGDGTRENPYHICL